MITQNDPVTIERNIFGMSKPVSFTVKSHYIGVDSDGDAFHEPTSAEFIIDNVFYEGVDVIGIITSDLLEDLELSVDAELRGNV